MKAEVERVVIRDAHERLVLLRSAEVDLRNAGVVAEVVFETGERAVDVSLAPDDPA